jgi:hypothetical protein
VWGREVLPGVVNPRRIDGKDGVAGSIPAGSSTPRRQARLGLVYPAVCTPGEAESLSQKRTILRRCFLCSSSLTPSMQRVLVGIPLDVGHAMVAVVAQGRIVVVGQQLD